MEINITKLKESLCLMANYGFDTDSKEQVASALATIVSLESALAQSRAEAGQAILNLESSNICCDQLTAELEKLLNETRAEALKSASAPVSAMQGEAALTVWYGAMPETTGASNFTAILYRKGGDMCDGITIDRSEYPDRVRYEADRARYLIGELKDRPFILGYDADKHSGYTHPPSVQAGDVVVPREFLSEIRPFICSTRLVAQIDMYLATPTEPAKPEGVKCTNPNCIDGMVPTHPYGEPDRCPDCPPQPAPKERQARCVCELQSSGHPVCDKPFTLHAAFKSRCVIEVCKNHLDDIRACGHSRACHQNPESNQ